MARTDRTVWGCDRCASLSSRLRSVTYCKPSRLVCESVALRAVLLKNGVTWSVVAAAALLAEASEERCHVFSQQAAAGLYEETNQLTHLWRETVNGYKANAFLGSPPSWEQFISTVLHLDEVVILCWCLCQKTGQQWFTQQLFSFTSAQAHKCARRKTPS